MASKQAEQKRILNEAEVQLLTWAERMGKHSGAMRPVTESDRINVTRFPSNEPYIMLRQADIFGAYAKVKPLKLQLPTKAQLPPRPENDIATILPSRQTRSLGAVAASKGRHAVVQVGLARTGLAEKGERKLPNRRLVALGALAVTTLVAATGLYLSTKGHHGIGQTGAPHGTVSADQLTPSHSTIIGALGQHHHAVHHLISPDRVNILPGQGYESPINSYAAQHGYNHLNGAQNYQIYLGLEHKYGSHILSTPGYSMGGPNFGISAPGPASWHTGAEQAMDKLLKAVA